MRMLPVAAVSACLLGGVAMAQTGPVVGFMHAVHGTSEVAKTVAFYNDVFGISGQVRPFANAAVEQLTDEYPGAGLLRTAKGLLQLVEVGLAHHVQRQSLDEVGDDGRQLIERGDLVDGDQAGVAQLGGRPRLAEEPLPALLRLQKRRVRQLQGHDPVQLGVAGLPDRTEAAQPHPRQ